MHKMFNVVTGEEGEASAVLVRAVEPVTGVDVMRKRRGVEEVEQLTDGPGKVAEALSISRRHDGDDITRGELRIEEGSSPDGVETSTRIGLGVECDMPLRFYVPGDRYVSR